MILSIWARQMWLRNIKRGAIKISWYYARTIRISWKLRARCANQRARAYCPLLRPLHFWYKKGYVFNLLRNNSDTNSSYKFEFLLKKSNPKQLLPKKKSRQKMVRSIDLNFGIDRILLPTFSTRKSILATSESTKSSRFTVKELTKIARKPTKISPSGRKRITFTEYQLSQLEIVFRENQYVHGGERILLAKKLGLEPVNVKNWFQNRRIRYRRKQNTMSSSDSDN